jgi:hypothetical protein
MGDVQARSWIEALWLSAQHAARPLGTLEGSLQSTPAALQVYWLQRQDGFSIP